jgi:hypothetical protein
LIWWIVTKDDVYAQYLRVVDRSNTTIMKVKYMAAIGDNGKAYPVKGGRLTKLNNLYITNVVEANRVPEPDNYGGDVYYDGHTGEGDWRRAIKNNDVFAQPGEAGAVLEFSYGDDVLVRRIVVKLATATTTTNPLWIELLNSFKEKVFEFEMKDGDTFDFKVRPMTPEA